MERIKYRISLDMFEVATQTTIKAKKGDTACSIYITLTENGKIYNITDGCYAVFSAKKPDGNYIFNSDTCSIEDNAIVYDFTEQTVPCEGVVECEIILFKDEQRLTSPRFNLVVDSTVYNGEEIFSTTSIDVFDQMMEEIKDRVIGEIGGNGSTDAVSYSQAQNLTEKQKETARSNINAVDASLVVSSISDDSQIPNGAGVRDAIEEITLHSCVRCDVEQPLTDAFKQIARENINAVDASLVVDNLAYDKQLLVDHIPNGQALQSFIEANSVSSATTQSLSDAKKAIARENISAMVNKEWKIIATGKVEEDGVTRITITKDNDGNPFEIYDALVVYTDAPIATETINIYLLVNNQYSNLAFQALHKSEKRFARITANWDGGNWAGISLVAGNSYSYVVNVGGMTQYFAKKSPATSISLSTESTTPFPIGTKFELRGVVKV